MKLSIITVSYNDKTDLEKTIASVECQTCQDFEWIMIDGASKDGSKELIQQHASHFAYWISERDKGRYNAMNKGVAASTGDYILFLGAGAYLDAPNTLERLLPHLGNSDYIFCNVNRVDEKAEVVTTTDYTKRLAAGTGFWFYRAVYHEGMLISGDLLRKRPYVEIFSIAAYWEHAFNQLIIKNGSYKVVDIVLTNVPLDASLYNNGYKMEVERNSVLERYFSKREIDEKQLQYLISAKVANYKYFISELAVRAFYQQRYSNQTFISTFQRYKDIICSAGTLKMRILNWLNIHHLFFVARLVSRTRRRVVAQAQAQAAQQ